MIFDETLIMLHKPIAEKIIFGEEINVQCVFFKNINSPEVAYVKNSETIFFNPVAFSKYTSFNWGFNPLSVLCHEMIHIRDFRTGKLHTGANGAAWLGTLIKEYFATHKFYEMPWEIESYSTMTDNSLKCAEMFRTTLDGDAQKEYDEMITSYRYLIHNGKVTGNDFYKEDKYLYAGKMHVSKSLEDFYPKK